MSDVFGDVFIGTTKQFAEKVGVEYQVAQGLVTFLADKGLATKKGEVKSPSGKGKPSTIWEFPLNISLVNGWVPLKAEVTVIDHHRIS